MSGIGEIMKALKDAIPPEVTLETPMKGEKQDLENHKET